MKKWILGIGLGLCACVVCGLAGVKSASYVQDSSAYVSFGIDIHDIDKVIESNATSLLDSQYVRTLQGKRLLAIADIANETSEDIDVELMARKLARALRKSGKFTLTNAIAGSGAKADRFIQDSRKLTKDPTYNQYTTHEQDTLQAPELSLSGKIAQRSKKIGEVVRFDYIFLLTLSDIKSGKVVWDNEEIISKVADPSVSSEIERHNALRQREKELQNQARQREQERQAKARQREKELQALRSKCQGEDGEACATLAEKGDIKGLQGICDSKVGLACNFLGGYYLSKHDVKQALLWFQKDCDVGDELYGFSCKMVAHFYMDAKNYPQAFKFHTKACDGGVMSSCNDLGFLYQNGLGVRQDVVKALELYAKACDDGEGLGCENAGGLYDSGNAGVKKDLIKARSYYTKACDLSSAPACFNLAIMYDKGEGGAKDEAKALDMFEKACNLGYGKGCSNAGTMLVWKQQYGKARQLYEKGCGLGGAKACYNLALLYSTGQGARHDYGKAKELAGKACDLGDQNGCEAYKDLNNAGY